MYIRQKQLKTEILGQLINSTNRVRFETGFIVCAKLSFLSSLPSSLHEKELDQDCLCFKFQQSLSLTKVKVMQTTFYL
jgi:hypothetical protein